ncbi:MAG: hypothetical protein A2868_02010 [Candidatus Levybacteria bacterium RIFCSPHIGHO2_01_FULL_40_15b]|nr:MAG: hypothetical protein A2868_02010 [Candidatus Levybacteria bacterium RIFCSPHIGHO2_01_FULL_40_15b]
MQTVGIVRQRGQLTIPDSVRKAVKWIAPPSAVSISVVKPDEIIIRPQSSVKEEVDWDQLLKDIKKLQAYPVKGTMSEFIVWDREYGHND